MIWLLQICLRERKGATEQNKLLFEPAFTGVVHMSTDFVLRTQCLHQLRLKCISVAQSRVQPSPMNVFDSAHNRRILFLQCHKRRQPSKSTPIPRWSCQTAPLPSSVAPSRQVKWCRAPRRWPGVSSQISPTTSSSNLRMWWVVQQPPILHCGFPATPWKFSCDCVICNGAWRNAPALG